MPFFSLPTGGSPVLAGSGAPTGSLGNVGDLFIDKTNQLLYGPKELAGWPSGPVDLSNGPTGAASTVTGPTGPASTVTGPTGPASTVTGPTGPASTVTGPTGRTGPASTVTGPTGAASTVTGPTGQTGPASTVTGPTGVAGSFSDAQAINAQTTGYTLALSDAGKLVTLSDTTGTLEVVIPAAASVAFPTGTHVDIARIGDAGVTVTGATGVTVNATPGATLRDKYSAGTAILYEGDTWLLIGDLT